MITVDNKSKESKKKKENWSAFVLHSSKFDQGHKMGVHIFRQNKMLLFIQLFFNFQLREINEDKTYR